MQKVGTFPIEVSFCFSKYFFCITCHNNSCLVFLSFSFMARKLYALALEKCAPESADNPMMQEILLGGHLYLMCLKVVERINASFFSITNSCHLREHGKTNLQCPACSQRLEIIHVVIRNTP